MKKKLTKIEEYDLNLKVRNLCKQFEKDWKNNLEKEDMYGLTQKESGQINREESFHSKIKKIEDKKLRLLFKKLYNIGTKKGNIQSTIKKSGIDMNIVYRTKKKLQLPNFDLGTNRQNLELEIIEKYILEKLSSEDIGNQYNFNGANILHILKKNNIKIRDSGYNNIVKFKTKQPYSPEELQELLTRKFKVEKKSIKQIKKETGLDESCISNKLKAYGFQIKPSKLKTGIIKQCLWCKTQFDAYIITGPRTQNYCSKRCNCKAKDLRAKKGTTKRIENMIQELENTWGNQFEDKLKEIFALSKKPLISINENQHQLNIINSLVEAEE